VPECAAVRYYQLLPVALLALFATGLCVAIALVHLAKNKADKDYMDEEAVIDGLRNNVYDQWAWVDKDDRQEKFIKRMKALDERHEQAERQWQAAKDAAYARQGYIIIAGVVLFVIFVAVTIYMGRKSANEPSAQ
jgi:hypothetical protein